ncbi:MAG: hypothetical protein HQL39_10305 [Alphaproteobacteria bacterium]|nr:hypothetical protein [Alphaproteobacteria bacterium]
MDTRSALRALVLALFLLAAPHGAGAGQFLAAVEDLPLMPGLAETAEGSLVFETPQGRIIEASAEGRLKPEAVQSFYDATLPQLGWQPVGSGFFRREGEVLTVTVGGAGGGRVLVHFSVLPE